jgi:hypothetical protein
MAERPSRLWRDLPADKRIQVAEAFWRDETSEDVQVQQLEATVLLAKRLNFRPKSVLSLSVERRAKHLAQMNEVSDPVATRALIAYHFATMRPLMAAFLDALGIGHDHGLITDEPVEAPDRQRLETALATVSAAFPLDDVDLYAKTLTALDSDTWRNLDGLTASTASRGT